MTITYFILSVFGALLTVNLFKPVVQQPLLAVPSFIFGWLVGELVVFVFVIQAVCTLLFVAAGAVTGLWGTLGVLLTLASWLGMARYLQLALRTDQEVERALQATLGTGYQQSIKQDLQVQIPAKLDFARLRKPFSPHLPQVECIKDAAFYEEKGVQLALDIYCNRTRPENAPVLFQIHGGAWTEKMGDKNQQALPLMNQLASMGWVCVAVSYQLSPRATFPTHIVDCKRGLAWTKQHISEYGGNPNFIIATGGSAGGHLSSLLALSANVADFQPGFEDVDTSVQACVPFYGVYDFSDENQLHNHDGLHEYLEEKIMKLPRTDKEAYRKASPLHYIHQDAPPFFVIHGTCDSLTSFNEGRHFAEELRKTSNQPVVFAPITNAQHAFDMFRSPRSEYVMFAVVRFVNYIYSLYLQQIDDSESHAADSSQQSVDAA